MEDKIGWDSDLSLTGERGRDFYGVNDRDEEEVLADDNEENFDKWNDWNRLNTVQL